MPLLPYSGQVTAAPARVSSGLFGSRGVEAFRRLNSLSKCSRTVYTTVSTAAPAPEPKQAPALKTVTKQVLLRYDAALHAHPVLTKAVTSFLGFALGDYLAQAITGVGMFNSLRCLRLSLYGLLIDGPVGHLWYRFLDGTVFPEAPTSNKAVLSKTALDQFVWGPAMTVVFFAFLKTLEGRPDLILATVKSKLWKVMVANYMVWPLAHFASFKWVPTEYRVLYNNVVSVAWNAWLSWSCVGTAGKACRAPGGGG